jgi:predicted RNA methylase
MKKKKISSNNKLKILDNVSHDNYPECSKKCLEYEVACPEENSSCRMWVNYGEDMNCTHISVINNGRMTLREIADRLGVSYVRVCQIESATKRKMYKGLSTEAFY